MMNGKLNVFCNGQSHPILLDLDEGPWFSWKFAEDVSSGFLQHSYQIVVKERDNIIWNSGRIESPTQHMINYTGPELLEFGMYRATIKSWGIDGETASGEIKFEPGISEKNLCKSVWIGGNSLLRRDFSLPSNVKYARLYISAIGYYEVRINGEKADDQTLTPSFTDIDKRVEFQAYDVTHLVRKGNNASGIMLGRGMIWNSPRRVSEPYAIFYLRIVLEDDSIFELRSDGAWQSLESPIVFNSVYKGEHYDARLEKEGWDKADYAGITKKVNIIKPYLGKFSPQILPPIRITGEIKPIKIKRLENYNWMVDYGQNLVGVVRLTVKGERGTTVTIRPGEIIFNNGHINQHTLRQSDVYDSYILRGHCDKEIHTPRFTYHGFRYVEISNYPGELMPENVVACTITSDVHSAGSFKCSDDLYNCIHNMMRWTIINNLHSIPTDCPQRNERQGWMADGFLASEEAIYNFNMHWFYRKWINDITDTLDKNGMVGAPTAPSWGAGNFFPWKASIFIMPWYLYRLYGDTALIKKLYSTLRNILLKYETFLNEDGLISEENNMNDGIQWDSTSNDWLALDRTQNIIVLNGFLYRECTIMEEFANCLGQIHDRQHWNDMSEKIKNGYNKVFYHTDKNEEVPGGFYGGVNSNSQYAQALPMSLGIVPEEQYNLVLKNLLWDIQQSRGSVQLSTGILGTKCLIDFLEAIDRNDIVAKLFSRREFPGWGFMVTNGATTVWERWTLMKGGGMNSHNHPALASAGTWFYRGLCGIYPGRIDETGRCIFTIKPYIPNLLEWAEASWDTPWGVVSSKWQCKDGKIEFSYVIPPNTRGEIIIQGKKKIVGPGVYSEKMFQLDPDDNSAHRI
jgi:alpha-L-rhamnosidase